MKLGRQQARRRAAILVAMAVFLPTFGRAAKHDVIGVGTASCGRWIAVRRDRHSALHEQWVLGFLSAVGFMGTPRNNPLNGVDAEAVFARLDRYCQDHPTATIEHSAIEFLIAHPRGSLER